jgi:hypothetical protein
VESLCPACQHAFRPPLTESRIGELALLCRDNTIEEYYNKFMALSCRDPAILEDHQVQLFRPTTDHHRHRSPLGPCHRALHPSGLRPTTTGTDHPRAELETGIIGGLHQQTTDSNKATHTGRNRVAA